MSANSAASAAARRANSRVCELAEPLLLASGLPHPLHPAHHDAFHLAWRYCIAVLEAPPSGSLSSDIHRCDVVVQLLGWGDQGLRSDPTCAETEGPPTLVDCAMAICSSRFARLIARLLELRVGAHVRRAMVSEAGNDYRALIRHADGATKALQCLVETLGVRIGTSHPRTTAVARALGAEVEGVQASAAAATASLTS